MLCAKKNSTPICLGRSDVDVNATFFCARFSAANAVFTFTLSTHCPPPHLPRTPSVHYPKTLHPTRVRPVITFTGALCHPLQTRFNWLAIYTRCSLRPPPSPLPYPSPPSPFCAGLTFLHRRRAQERRARTTPKKKCDPFSDDPVPPLWLEYLCARTVSLPPPTSPPPSPLLHRHLSLPPPHPSFTRGIVLCFRVLAMSLLNRENTGLSTHLLSPLLPSTPPPLMIYLAVILFFSLHPFLALLPCFTNKNLHILFSLSLSLVLIFDTIYLHRMLSLPTHPTHLRPRSPPSPSPLCEVFNSLLL